MYYLLLQALLRESKGKDLFFVTAIEPKICAAIVQQQEIPEGMTRLSFVVDPNDLDLDYFSNQSSIGDPPFTGNVSIYSELDLCSSCSNIIDSFSNNFPGLNVTTNHGLPYDY